MHLQKVEGDMDYQLGHLQEEVNGVFRGLEKMVNAWDSHCRDRELTGDR